MRENYDFSEGKKNPYSEQVRGKYTVTVHYDFANSSENKRETENEKTERNSRAEKQA